MTKYIFDNPRRQGKNNYVVDVKEVVGTGVYRITTIRLEDANWLLSRIMKFAYSAEKEKEMMTHGKD